MIAGHGAALQLQKPPPLSLYVHIPWCVRKCPYCDFNSHELKGPLRERELVDALLQDLDADLRWVAGRSLLSIYLGGGTPSLVAPAEIARLLAGVRERVNLSAACEITLEVNPGTVTGQQLAGYRAAGVNRLSIGVQSFDPSMLAALGRIHGREEAMSAIEGAQQAGFERINLDLIHTLPGQRPEQALQDLRTALTFQTGHLSWYQLTIEPNTLFYRKPPPLPDDGVQWEIYRQGNALLRTALNHYEISAFASPGHEARHNLNYWEFGDYLGIGPGAHGKITQPERQRILRTVKLKQPQSYLAATERKLAYERPIAADQIALEFLLNALRLTRGVSRTLFEERSGMPIESIAPFVRRAVERKLLRKGARIQPTARGLRYLNNLLELI